MARRVVEAVGFSLVRLGRVEAPEAAVGLQELRRVLPLGALGAVGVAHRVGRRPHLDVEAAVLVEGERLGLVLVLGRQAGDDRLLLARGLELALSQLVAVDRGVRRVVEPAVAHRDAGTTAVAERLLHVGAAVAGGVAQADDAGLAGLHIDVAVRRRRDVAQRPERVGENDCMEAGRQLDAAVIRIGLRQRRRGEKGPGGEGGQDDERDAGGPARDAGHGSSARDHICARRSVAGTQTSGPSPAFGEVDLQAAGAVGVALRARVVARPGRPDRLARRTLREPLFEL